jgi:hypothetical protein
MAWIWMDIAVQSANRKCKLMDQFAAEIFVMETSLFKRQERIFSSGFQ